MMLVIVFEARTKRNGVAQTTTALTFVTVVLFAKVAVLVDFKLNLINFETVKVIYIQDY